VPIHIYQENQERPPLDFFSAIFDNQDSDAEDMDEENQERTNDDSRKTSNAPTVPAAIITFPKQELNYSIEHSDSSDSSIEEIENPGMNT
jgi:hypothetical protein